MTGKMGGALFGRMAGLCVCIIAAAAGACRAQTPQEYFQEGNAAYAKGQFAQAASLYESALAGGLNHWALYYNLANAYYKTDRAGKAVVNYMRSVRMHPDDDAIYNLNLVSTKVGDPALPTTALAALLWRVFYICDLDILVGVTSIMFIIICGGAGLMLLLRKRMSIEAAAGVLAIFALAAAWTGARTYHAERKEAVVIAPAAEVRSGPSMGHPANFTVPEGHRVLVLNSQDTAAGWLEIGVPREGLKGWTQASSAEIR